MGTRNPPNLVDLDLDARLLDRLRNYAAQRGLSFEEVLLQSVEAFLNSLPSSEFEPVSTSGIKSNARKRC